MVIQALIGTGISMGSVVLSYGCAQHFSHIAKTAEHTERIYQLMSKRDAPGS